MICLKYQLDTIRYNAMSPYSVISFSIREKRQGGNITAIVCYISTMSILKTTVYSLYITISFNILIHFLNNNYIK